MTKYFSASFGGFVEKGTHDPLPDDAIQLTKKRHAALVAANEAGAAVVADSNGKPEVVWPPARDHSYIMRRVKREAARRIKIVFPIWAQINAIRMGLTDDPRFDAIDGIRAASTLIEQDLQDSAKPAEFPIADHPLWPEKV